MPKVSGTSKEQRAAMMSDALAEEGSEPIDLPPADPVVTPVVVTPVAPAPPAQDMAALIQALATAIAQSGAQSADAIKAALSDQAAMARAPIAETYLSGGYPEKSVYSHPDGDLKHPRTVVRCPMYLGVFTEKGEIIPAFEIFPDVCTETERQLLNQLQPGKFPVERNDGVKSLWRVVDQKDDLDQTTRLVIAVPATWLSKAEQNQMPSQKRFLMQLIEGAAVAA